MSNRIAEFTQAKLLDGKSPPFINISHRNGSDGKYVITVRSIGEKDGVVGPCGVISLSSLELDDLLFRAIYRLDWLPHWVHKNQERVAAKEALESLRRQQKELQIAIDKAESVSEKLLQELEKKLGYAE